MSRLALRELCGYRAGDKGDIANVAIFADDDDTYALITHEVTAERVKAHFGAMVRGRFADIVAWDADHEGAFTWSYGLKPNRIWRGGEPVPN